MFLYKNKRLDHFCVLLARIGHKNERGFLYVIYVTYIMSYQPHSFVFKHVPSSIVSPPPPPLNSVSWSDRINANTMTPSYHPPPVPPVSLPEPVFSCVDLSSRLIEQEFQRRTEEYEQKAAK